MSRAREFGNFHLQLGKKKKNTRIVCLPSKPEKSTNNRADIENFKNKRTNSNPLCSIVSYRINSLCSRNISDLYLYDAIQFITLLPINSIKTIDDRLAMNFVCRLINAGYVENLFERVFAFPIYAYTWIHVT